ncbi:hypothetical protein AGMMS50293_25560 [Spirochaetia bacterium]|nr:hypothetical protein AGMMS50293_25560 [Spirochaetia bacterium]
MSELISTDIVVIGGGVAGVCAALAAARQGASVSFITDRPVLGGNSSSEIRVWTRGAGGGGNLLSEEMGILGELKMRNLYTNPEFNVFLWDEVLLDVVLAESKIKLFLNTHVTGPELEDKRIRSVRAFQLDSEREFVFTGAYFIDATGDGTIGAAAGIPFVQGREGKDTYGEPNAPDKADPYTMGNSLFFISRKTDKPVPFIPPAYIHGIEKVKEFISGGGRVVNEKLNGCDYWWFEFGGTIDTIRDSQDIALELKRVSLGVWNYIKNSGEFDAANLTLEWVGSVPGKRESRRFTGAYVLKQQDLMNRTLFEDTVAYGGWYMDFHPAGGVYATESSCVQIPVFAYGIPFRCLYNPDFPNLLFAGRDISVSRAVFASSRDMDTCALTGHAAGTGAAWAVAHNVPPPKMKPEDIHRIQQLLLDGDLGLPALVKDAGKNLARKAKITVSSCLENLDALNDPEGAGELAQAGTVLMNEDWFLLVTKKKDVAFCEVLTKSAQKLTLQGKVSKQALPSRLANDPEARQITLDIAGGTGWTRIDFPPDFKAYEGFVMLTFPAADLALLTTAIQTTGFLAGLQWSADYRYPRVRMDIAGLYGPANLQDGVIRPYGTPRSWISGNEKEPTVTLEWEGEIKPEKLKLYFNPDLNREIPSSIACSLDSHHFFTPRQAMPPELVKDYRIELRKNGTWSVAGIVTDNWQYASVFQFPTADTDDGSSGDAVRVVVESTYGSPRAEVFEIEIY